MPEPEDVKIPGIKLLERIGSGTHSIVYRGIRNGASYAVKVPQKTERADEIKTTRRFRQEAAALARIQHPGLPAIMEFNSIDGLPYLIMEHIAGDSLATRLEHGSLPEEEIVPVAVTLADILSHVHRAGMVHRDLKPHNILFTTGGIIKLIDFGFVTHVLSPECEETAAGTILYSSPEQLGILKRPVDGRSDLYALGVTLYEAATGAPPFRAADIGELVHLHATAIPPSSREMNPGVSKGLSLIIAKLMAKDPDDRYQSGAGLLYDLEHIADINRDLSAGKTVELDIVHGAFGEGYQRELVGRDRELTLLKRCWSQTRQGVGALLLVEGLPGSGKSRLIRELLLGLDKTTALVLEYKCSKANPIPLAPLRISMDRWLDEKLHASHPDRRQHEERVRAAARETAPFIKRLSKQLGHLFADTPDILATE